MRACRQHCLTPPIPLITILAGAAASGGANPSSPSSGGDGVPPPALVVGANVTVTNLMPRTYIEASRLWTLYRPAGAVAFLWASVGDPTGVSSYLPVCTKRGEAIVDYYAAMACWNDPGRAGGYVLGYGLPPWYLAHRPGTTLAPAGGGALLGPAAAGPPRFLTDLECGGGGADSPQQQCAATVADSCEDYALLSCIPHSSGACVRACVRAVCGDYDNDDEQLVLWWSARDWLRRVGR